jgi:predicted DCC family thiol-disulfide oxidoreductase YuxK
MMSIYPLTLYYDASCPLCLSEITNLRWRDFHGRLQFVDVSQVDFVSPLENVTVADLMAQMHARTADGQVLVGVPVFEQAYAAVGLHQVAAALRWRGWRWLLDRLYPVVARHRQRAPQALIQLVFGQAVRRAARQAANQRCDAGQCAIGARSGAGASLPNQERRPS